MRELGGKKHRENEGVCRQNDIIPPKTSLGPAHPPQNKKLASARFIDLQGTILWGSTRPLSSAGAHWPHVSAVRLQSQIQGRKKKNASRSLPATFRSITVGPGRGVGCVFFRRSFIDR